MQPSPSKGSASASARERALDVGPEENSVRVLLSYSSFDLTVADELAVALESAGDLVLSRHRLDERTRAERLTEAIGKHDAVVQIVSHSLLRSVDCMKELMEVTKSAAARALFRSRGVPLVIEKRDESVDLFAPTGPIQLADYWFGQKRLVEDALKERDDEVASAVAEVREDAEMFADIGSHLTKFMRTVTGSLYVSPLDAQQKNGYVDVVSRVRVLGEERKKAHNRQTRRPAKGGRSASKAGAEYEEPSREVLRLRDLASRIKVPSEKDPENPEYPPFSPRFPATPAYRVHVPRLERDILIKDESFNFTGSHKDRMAWETVVYYKELIEERLEPHAKTLELPSLSIISNGSAAFAIQTMLRVFGLPPLRVLVDHKTFSPIVSKLESMGCLVYRHNLADRELDSPAVLNLTDNEGGHDITARSVIDPERRTYYDWLAYEILNCGAKHIFIPVGTGDLFVNVLTVLEDETEGDTGDRRLQGGSELVEGLQIYGATSSDRKTKMNKLYAPYRPTLRHAREYVERLVRQGVVGANSKIYDVGETIIPEAVSVARAGKVHCDESGIAGLSLLIQLSYRREFPREEEILVVNTGWLPL
jgi:Pyridoxal-phosphate dependent enzyme/TIR domain